MKIKLCDYSNQLKKELVKDKNNLNLAEAEMKLFIDANRKD